MKVIAIFLCVLYFESALAVPLQFFFSYGANTGDTPLPPNDDSFRRFNFVSNSKFIFYGQTHNPSDIYINNNGVISLTEQYTSYTPEKFPLNDVPPLIAPFWADVDTTGTGTVWYRQTNDKQELMKAKDIVANAFPGIPNFNATEFLFIVTWDRVGYYSSHTDKTNTFQCILASDGTLSFVIFLYADGEIEWTTGDASNGVNGTGGIPAQAGFDSGNTNDFKLIEGSFTHDIINIDKKSNVNWPGMFVFKVNGEEIVPSVQGLTISPWFGNSFGGVPISVSGPTFYEDDIVTCLFDDIGVEGVVLNSETVLCVSPRLILEQGTRAEFRIRIYNTTYKSTASFYPLSLEDSGDLDVEIVLTDTLLFSQDDQVKINWNPVKLRQSINNVLPDSTSGVEVDIRVFEISKDNYEFNDIGVAASRLPNNGSATISFSEVDLGNGNDTHQVALFIQPLLATNLKRSSVWDFLKKIGRWTATVLLRPIVTKVFAWRYINCLAWTLLEPPSIGQEILENVRREFPCPLTLDLALNEGTLQMDNRLIGIFHPKASNCFRQRDGLEARANGYGNQCCYKGNSLLVGPSSGGTVDKVAPAQSKFRHFLQDVYPFLMCCPELCDKYYERRPSDDGTAYEPPDNGFMFGDPHIVTLDLYKYTFNGKGEFILIQTNDSSFTVQGRMIEATGSSDSLVSATVFSAIVAKQDMSDTVQVEIYNEELVILVNGRNTDFSELTEQRFNNVTIYNLGDSTFAVLFSRGEFIKIVNENGFLSNMVLSLPKRYKGKTSGLMGTYNGDNTDDLIPRGSNTPLAMNSTIDMIHESFGTTWIINNSSESLFKYLFGLQWSMFYSPGFSPTYTPVFNDPDLEANATNICDGDLFCLFDIATTGIIEIGVSTLRGGLSVEALVERSKPIICDPSCANGACVANDTCFCSEGFSGDLCDNIVYTECIENPCQNNASCKLHSSYTVCECPPQYTSALCDEVITNCEADNPCMNGGTCRFDSGTYTCECPPQYTSALCDEVISKCVADNPCKNGGTCRFEAETYICECPPQYTSAFCDEVISECIGINSCMNGETCRFESGTYVCECSGDNCETRRASSEGLSGAVIAGTVGGLFGLLVVAAIILCSIVTSFKLLQKRKEYKV